jgi:hypothetical protein
MLSRAAWCLSKGVGPRIEPIVDRVDPPSFLFRGGTGLFTAHTFLATPLAAVLTIASFASAQELTTIQPAESGPVHNPLKGFRPGADKIYSPVLRPYIKWSDLERCEADSPARLTAYLNKIAASAPKHNSKLVPRVYLDWDGTKDARGEPRQYWPADMYRFDYQSPTFIARLRRLIRRMGEAWNGDPRIGFVEMGMIGFWGEMHNPAPWGDMRQLLTEEFAKAFPDKPVLVRVCQEPFMQAGFGIYYDTFGAYNREPERFTASPGPQVPTWALTHEYRDQWKRAPIEGEVEYHWQNQRPETRPDETFGRSPDETLKVARYRRYMADLFRRYHVSYMGWISGFTPDDPQVVAGAAVLNEAMGYRFVITSFSWTAQPKPALRLRFSVRNDGSAPFYHRWPLAAALLDPKTRQVKWQTDLQADIRRWLPGDDWDAHRQKWNVPPQSYAVDETISIPPSIPDGDYVLALAILDAQGGRLPSVRFAIKNYWTGGWHPLGFVGIGHAPQQKEVPGPFFEGPRDESLHYEVPASILAVRDPPVPSFKPVSQFTLQPDVELIDPYRYWNFDGHLGKVDQHITPAGPGGTLAYTAEGDFGAGSYQYYSAWQETWPTGHYLLSLQVRGTKGLSAAFNLADEYRPITPTTQLPLEPDWKRIELALTIKEPFTKYPRLRLWLPRNQTGIFSFADVHLKRVSP